MPTGTAGACAPPEAGSPRARGVSALPAECNPAANMLRLCLAPPLAPPPEATAGVEGSLTPLPAPLRRTLSLPAAIPELENRLPDVPEPPIGVAEVLRGFVRPPALPTPPAASGTVFVPCGETLASSGWPGSRAGGAGRVGGGGTLAATAPAAPVAAVPPSKTSESRGREPRREGGRGVASVGIAPPLTTARRSERGAPSPSPVGTPARPPRREEARDGGREALSVESASAGVTALSPDATAESAEGDVPCSPASVVRAGRAGLTVVASPRLGAAPATAAVSDATGSRLEAASEAAAGGAMPLVPPAPSSGTAGVAPGSAAGGKAAPAEEAGGSAGVASPSEGSAESLGGAAGKGGAAKSAAPSGAGGAAAAFRRLSPEATEEEGRDASAPDCRPARFSGSSGAAGAVSNIVWDDDAVAERS